MVLRDERAKRHKEIELCNAVDWQGDVAAQTLTLNSSRTYYALASLYWGDSNLLLT